MALQPDKQELVRRKRKHDADKVRHQEESIAKYGSELGTAYHQYIYDSDTLPYFSRTIAGILESPSTTEKALAIQAMITASEEYTEKKIKEAVSIINPVY